MLFIAFIILTIVYICINVCMHHTIMLLPSSVQVVPLFGVGVLSGAKTQARVYT